MNFPELFLIAVGLSMDAFAVAVCAGLTMPKATVKKAFVVGAYFGVFQAGMPVIGYLVATLFADTIIAYDHWVAFVLLGFLGGKMIVGSFQKESAPDEARPAEIFSLKPAKMLPLAVATSIDALAVGVSLAFLKVDIVPAASFIGVVTLLLSMLGVKIGNLFGMRFKSRAELFGGVILVGLGIHSLLGL